LRGTRTGSWGLCEQDSDLAAKHAYASLSALDAATERLSGVLYESKETVAAVQSSAANIARASAAESEYWNKTARETSLAARDMRQLIARTDRELNDKFLPDLDEQLAQTSTAAQIGMESITKAGDALTFQIQDPAISQMLDSFNHASASLASASAHANSSLASVDHTFAYYDKQLTTPLGFWKTAAKTLLSTGSQAGNIYGGFIK
jgi:hypothetical protein